MSDRGDRGFVFHNYQYILNGLYSSIPNKCLLNPAGKKIFVQAFEERLNETIQHRSLKRKVSYRHLIKLECYKLSKHLLGMEEYKPFKMYW